ncbi:hypothetical protein O181_101921 [Austropuccinia psidii MF-1]|uniref:Integrase catalytic domain-containing protein n=1 Tax=Austropuccinia psidii MF-1 TaxID=1389203 RepID=A0A9Q3PJ42_9BASI|nr:hypothetical protein [Austropuccinia psidii MF-1]
MWSYLKGSQGGRSYNEFLVLVGRYRKTPMFLPCHKDDTAMETAIMIWNKVITHTGLLQDIISDRGPKFTSALWKNLHNLFGRRLSFSTAYHPKLMGLEFKVSDVITHDWCTLIPALELAYKESIRYSTVKKPEILEKGWNTILPYDTLKKDLVDIHPTASSFKLMLDKSRHHSNRCMHDSFKYAKERWDKIHKPPDFKVGDLVLV